MVAVMPELTREGKVLIFVLGEIEGLKEKGIVQGGRYQLSEGATAIFHRLRESGFKPTEEEVDKAMLALQSEPD